MTDNFEKLIAEIKLDKSGESFENFCKWFLENDPYWKTQVRKVWLWDHWPERWDIDKGIDLIFEHKDGRNWAIQSKCYSDNHYIKKEDIDSFLSESNRANIHQRLLIGTTDKIGKNAWETMNGQEKPVRALLLRDLKASSIQYPSSQKKLGNRVVKREINKRRPYQQLAIKNVLEGFRYHNRGKLIMACGTGKTIVTLWIKEELRSNTTLVFVPSLNLLSQTLHEWTSHSKDLFEVLCVCSDTTVGKQDRDEDMRVTDAYFDVTSEISKISQFLKLKKNKVIFSTYQSSDLVSQAQRKEEIDLIIFDEAHRCTGFAKSSFTKILDGKIIKARKRLFTTATPRIFSSSISTVAGKEGKEIYGMDNEKIYGPNFFEYTFGQAIRDGWLSDYQVVIVGVDEPNIKASIDSRELIALENNKYEDAETLASKIIIAKAIKDYQIKRLISFHNRIKAAKTFSRDFNVVMKLLNKKDKPLGIVWADYISGRMTTRVRQRKLRQLKDLNTSDIGILSNAKCLSEGVDVPTLDGVAFIEPKGSQIDIVQSVGRALRKSEVKSVGTIILPVFLNKNEDENDIIEKSSFKPVWDVLKALRSHDNLLAEELDTLRQSLTKKSKRRMNKPSKIILDFPKEYDDEFSENIFTILLEETTASWHFWIGLLIQFNKKYKHTIVPQNYIYDGKYKLGQWVSTTRKRKSILSAERINQLEKFSDWVWNYEDYLFKEGVHNLEEFHKIFGHYNVPRAYKDDKGYPLGQWVAHRKEDKKLGRLTKEKLNFFNSLDGWIWSVQDQYWQEAIKQLKEYEKNYGNVLVPANFISSDGFKLGGWVSGQKSKKTLSKVKIEQLEAFETWSWNTFETKWFIGIEHLIGYVVKNKHSSIPFLYKTKEGFSLGRWTYRQREKKRNSTLSEQRINKLEAIKGWSWKS